MAPIRGKDTRTEVQVQSCVVSVACVSQSVCGEGVQRYRFSTLPASAIHPPPLPNCSNLEHLILISSEFSARSLPLNLHLPVISFLIIASVLGSY